MRCRRGGSIHNNNLRGGGVRSGGIERYKREGGRTKGEQLLLKIGGLVVLL